MNKRYGLLNIICILLLILSGCNKSDISNTKVQYTKNTANITQKNFKKTAESQKYSDEIYKWTYVNPNKNDLKELQISVDNGHTPKYLDPEQVAIDFLYNNMNLKGQEINIKEEDINDDNVIFNRIYTFYLKDGGLFQVKLDKPVRQDSTGIWYVEEYRLIKCPKK